MVAAPGRLLRLLRLSPLLLLTLAAPTNAQTTDPLFAGLRFAPQPPGSRPAGLGGAFVAVADGGKASYFNPAGLALVPRDEFELSFADPWLSLGSKLGVVRFSAYGTRTKGEGVPRTASTSFDLSHTEAGFGIAVAPAHALKIGVSGAWSTLDLSGERAAAGSQQSLTSVRGKNGHLRITAGMLVTLFASEIRGVPQLRLGLSYQPGFDWSADLTETGPAGPARRTIDFRRPSVLTGGLAYFGSDRWSFFAQGDVIRYGEVMSSLRRNVGVAGARGFDIKDVIEPRVGSETAFPLPCGCGTVKLRAGLHYRSPGTLVYGGADAALEQAFGVRSWRTVASVGGSFFTEFLGRALRFDLDSKDLFEGPALSFGIVMRF